MRSKPVVGKQVDKLYSIPGKVPNPINMPDYCYFKDRCELCCEKCSGSYPALSSSARHMSQLLPLRRPSGGRMADGRTSRKGGRFRTVKKVFRSETV